MSQTKLLAAALLRLGARHGRECTRRRGARQQRRVSRPRRRLHRLSFRARRQGFCRRLAHGNPHGRDLFDQHHARSRHRHRRLFARRTSIARCAAGIAKDGHHLYPAMPYPSYAKISNEDIQALYTFFMKDVPPVKQANKPDEIPWYLSPRWPLAVWNTIFARSGAYEARPDHDPAWNRGAYLVEGLGHCGACHSPRGWAFQEKALDDRKQRLSPRRGARCLVGAESARRPAHRPRRMVAGRYRAVPQERPQRQGRGLRLDARRRQQQHAVSLRRGHRRDGGVHQVAAGDGVGGAIRL